MMAPYLQCLCQTEGYALDHVHMLAGLLKKAVDSLQNFCKILWV